MPKRKLSAARKAQLAAWQAKGAAARKARSWSNPVPERKSAKTGGTGFPAAMPGSFGTVRRHKLGGKAYQKKVGGFTPAPAVTQILNKQPVTHPLKAFDAAGIHGDMVQHPELGLLRLPAPATHADFGHQGPKPGRLAPSLDSVGAKRFTPAPFKRKNYSKQVNPAYLVNKPQATHGSKHESVGSMSQKAKVAAAHGMSVAEYQKKMAADRRKQTAALKQKGLTNPFKKSPGPGKGH